MSLAVLAWLSIAPVQAQELLSPDTLAGRAREWLALQDERSGLRAGAFDLRAAAGMGLDFDSNVLAAPDSANGESLATAHLLLQAQNRASRHQFTALGFAETRRYSDTRSQDASEFGVGSEYTALTGPRDQLELSLSAERRFERRGDIETPDDLDVSTYDDLQARLRHTHVFNRLSISAGAESRRMAYRAESQSFRDRWQYRGELRAAYALRSNVSWTGTGWFGRDEFDQASEFTASADSAGALLGVQVAVRDVLDFELAAGAFQRRFDSSSERLDGVALRGALQWQPTRITRLRAELSRDDEPTAIPGSFGKVRSAFDVSLAHEFSRSLTLFAAARAVADEFTRIGREDRLYAAELGASWLTGRHSLLRLTLGHVSRESGAAQDDFSRHFASLSFTGRL